jgi:hypothetical protein
MKKCNMIITELLEKIDQLYWESDNPQPGDSIRRANKANRMLIEVCQMQQQEIEILKSDIQYLQKVCKIDVI